MRQWQGEKSINQVMEGQGMGTFNKIMNNKKIFILIFTIWPILFLVTFTYIPVFNMFTYSVTNWDGISKAKHYVGMSNYITVLTKPQYFLVFKVSLYYLVGSAVEMCLALFIAFILNFKLKFKNLFKGILFFPYLINGVAVSMIFLFLFQPDGVLDSSLRAIGLGSFIHLWLGDQHIINWSLVTASIWRSLGFSIVLFLGAMQSVDSDIYEAANIDGASSWRVFTNIIAPIIKPILTLSIILSIRGALSVFEIPFIMTGGANGSATFVIQTLQTAFNNRKVGLASAMAVVLLLIILIVTAIQKKLLEKE
jgi:ABC-type sugar transport system permease subunit